MYNVFNKSEIFYLTNLHSNKTYLIGNKTDLINFLANETKHTNNYPLIKDCEFFYNLNMGNDFAHNSFLECKINEDGFYYKTIKETTLPKKYLFFDGEGRTIDVRIFLDEVAKKCKDFKHNTSTFYWNPSWEYKILAKYKLKRKYGQKPRSHAGNWFRELPKVKKIKTLDSMFKHDEEFKEYHFKPLEDSNNPYPEYWDDTFRRCEGNWKSQYKTRHQYDIHSRYKTDVRKNIYNDDFTKEDIDKMLEEDFNKYN